MSMDPSLRNRSEAKGSGGGGLLFWGRIVCVVRRSCEGQFASSHGCMFVSSGGCSFHMSLIGSGMLRSMSTTLKMVFALLGAWIGHACTA